MFWSTIRDGKKFDFLPEIFYLGIQTDRRIQEFIQWAFILSTVCARSTDMPRCQGDRK